MTEPTCTAHDGHRITGRDPDPLPALLAEYGTDIVFPGGEADRGDRGHRPDLTAHLWTPRQEEPPVSRLTDLVNDLVTARFGQPALDPIDAAAPPGTQGRRIAAHNALIELARPGEHRYCGRTTHTKTGQECILREGHPDATFDVDRPGDRENLTRYYTCMDAEQRDRARRYLVHSEPDPARRA